MTTATPLGELEQYDEVEPRPVLLAAASWNDGPEREPAAHALAVRDIPVIALPEEGTGERAQRRIERHRLRRRQMAAGSALAAVLVVTATILGAARAAQPRPVSLVRAAAAPEPAAIRVVVVGARPSALRLLQPAAVRALPPPPARPARTEVRYYDRAGEAKARWVRDALGVGTLLYSPRRTEDVDVTVVAGKDLHTE